MNKLFVVMASLVICISSCKKETVVGPKGDTGPAGANGNANVKSEGPIVIEPSAWITNSDSLAWTAIIFSEKITQEIVDKGSVEVYFKKDNVWWSLPYTDGDATTAVGLALGKVYLVKSESHGGLPEKPLKADYRMVISASSANKPAKTPQHQTDEYFNSITAQ
jgi:hypothetical protein